MIDIQNCKVNGINHFGQEGITQTTIGNITDEAVQKYIKEQAEESRREDSRSAALQRTGKSACDTALLRANTKPPVELVVADSDR